MFILMLVKSLTQVSKRKQVLALALLWYNCQSVKIFSNITAYI